MRIFIAAGGRFHASHMTETLLAAGHDVSLITSYPASRFPRIPEDKIHSLVFAECFYRLGSRMGFEASAQAYKARNFGRAAAAVISRLNQGDLFLGWSPYSLETLLLRPARRHLLVHDSTHISHQTEILREEYRRFGVKFPDPYAIETREMQEYEEAEGILVLSQLARRSFEERGVDPKKIQVIPLAVDTSRFRAPEDLSVRLPLKVIYFGNLSLRKGVQYLLEATRDFSPRLLEVTLVGTVERHFRPVLARYPHARYLGPRRHRELERLLPTQHVYVFPTLEDGFGQTLPQAMTSGLVPIVTDRCGAAEILRPDQDGFILPPGDATALRRLLLELTDDTARVARMRALAAGRGARRDWEAYGEDLLGWVMEKSVGI